MIKYAFEEARILNHNYVGTEHILLGLIREHDGIAAQVLISLGLKLEELRDEVIDLLGSSAHGQVAPDTGLNPLKVETPPSALRDAIDKWLDGFARQLNVLNDKKNECLTNSGYEQVARMHDKAEFIRATQKQAEQGLIKILGSDASLLSTVTSIAGTLPDGHVSSGRLALAIIESDADLVEQLDSFLLEIHKVCKNSINRGC